MNKVNLCHIFSVIFGVFVVFSVVCCRRYIIIQMAPRISISAIVCQERLTLLHDKVGLSFNEDFDSTFF